MTARSSKMINSPGCNPAIVRDSALGVAKLESDCDKKAYEAEALTREQYMRLRSSD